MSLKRKPLEKTIIRFFFFLIGLAINIVVCVTDGVERKNEKIRFLFFSKNRYCEDNWLVAQMEQTCKWGCGTKKRRLKWNTYRYQPDAIEIMNKINTIAVSMQEKSPIMQMWGRKSQIMNEVRVKNVVGTKFKR